MPDPDQLDRDLLDAFGQRGDQAAFRQLVDRHAGLVYGTAMRRAGSSQLAEEAAQNTFAILARKSHQVRSGAAPVALWLHRTATYEAAKAQRAESRHLRKMDALNRSSIEDPARTSADLWSELHPHLDEAIGKLAERDRRLVLLHHYEGIQLKDIAARDGRTVSAVQKQHQRALAKLSRVLRRRGVSAASASMLAAGLTAQLTAPAPAAFAPGLAASALGAAPTVPLATLTTNTVVTMSTGKLAASSAALVLALSAIPIGVQRHAIANARSDVAALEAENAGLRTEHQLPAAPASATTRRGIVGLFDSPDPTGGRAAAVDIMALADDIYRSRDRASVTSMARVMKSAHAIAALPPGQLDALFDRIANADLSETKRFYLHETILQVLAEKNPAKALDLAADAVRSAPSSQFDRYAFLVYSPLRRVAAADPDAALEFYSAANAEDLLTPPSLVTGSHLSEGVASSLFAGLLESDEVKAIEFFATLPDSSAQTTALRRGSQHAVTGGNLQLHLDLIGTLNNESQRRTAYGDLAEAYGRNHRLTDKTVSFVESLGLDGEAAAYAILKAAFSQAYNRGSDVDDQLEWVREHSPDGFGDQNVGAVLGNFSRFNNQRADSLRKLGELRSQGAPDTVVSAYLANSNLTLGDPNRALELVASLGEPGERSEALGQFVRQWEQMPDRLAEYLRNSDLTASEVEQAMEHKTP